MRYSIFIIQSITWLSEVQPKLILNPRISLRTLLTSVKVPLSPQLSREQFAHPATVSWLQAVDLTTSLVLPWYVARHLLWRDHVRTVFPRKETVHLRLWGWLLHPLNNLPVGHNPHVLTLHLQIRSSNKFHKEKLPVFRFTCTRNGCDLPFHQEIFWMLSCSSYS